MAVSAFPAALQLVLAHEGGYVNHPRDPGGATNKGVTQRVYDAYRGRKGEPLRSVKLISSTEVADIYRKSYWDLCGANRSPAGIDYAMFDYAVNSGVNRAVKDLQRTLNEELPLHGQLNVDGAYGEKTYQALCEAMARDEVGFIERYCDRRMSFLRRLKTFDVFGKGWTRRVLGDKPNYHADEGDHGVVDYAVKFAKADLTYPIPVEALPTPIGDKEDEIAGKADPTDEKVITPTTQGGAGTIIGATGTAGQAVITAAMQVQPHVSETDVGRIAMIVFLLMMLVGGGMLVYSYMQKSRELA